MPGVLDGAGPKISVCIRSVVTPQSARPPVKSCRNAVEVRLARHTDLLECQHAEVSRSIDVQTGPIMGAGSVIAYVATAVGQHLEEEV
jgi:hypothetical protein